MIIMLVYLVWLCVSMQYCHLNTSLFIMYLNYISHHHQKFLCRRILAGFKIIIIVIISMVVKFGIVALYL